MKLFSRFVVVCALLAMTAAAHAQVTSLSLTSDPGDFIGGGQTTFLTPADGSFTASKNPDNGVFIDFLGQPGIFWQLEFAASFNQPLTVGTYTGATRFPFQANGVPGLAISGDGAGCNTLTGSFTVLEISYGDGSTINSFDATFEQHCDGVTPALRGEIRFDAHPVVAVNAPSRLNAPINQNVNFIVTSTDAQGRHVVLSASDLPAGATFVDNGDNTGTFNWTPSSAQIGNFFVTFTGDNQAGNTDLTKTLISVIQPPPPNDDFDNATVVPSFPFTTTEDVTNATVAPDDPFCITRNQTVWFAFTPTQNMRLEANTFGTSYDTALSVYTGTRGALRSLACNDDSNGTLQSRVRFDAVAGTTYYFEISSFFHVSGANLVFNLLLAPPPLTITPTVTQFGSVDPSTGAATISGFVTCDKQAFVTISGQLKQTHGSIPVSGIFSAFVACDGTTPWSAKIQTTDALFHGRASNLFTGGPADVSATASGFDFDNGVFIQRSFAVGVTLRGN
ncbi:MAG TPA: putative Ig domain-containing protein [Candidatus Angelobacter sp.]|nr:putative Ig domain-containing protein [Candidatus Angelobacter sp.]